MRVVVGMVTAVLSSPNRSIGWAQAGTGLVGFAVFAGFVDCIACLASAGVAGGSVRAPGCSAREDAALFPVSAVAKLARYEGSI